MVWAFPFYAVAFIAAGGFAVSFAVIAWMRRPSPGARPFAFLMLAVAEWAITRALEAAVEPAWAKIVWAKWEYPGIVSVPVLFLLFALEYGRVRTRWRTYYTALLWIIPVVTVFLAFTNEWHGLIWSSIEVAAGSPFQNLVYHHGGWFWLAAANNYALMATGIVILVKAVFRHPEIYRRHAVPLLAGIGVPVLGNGIYLAGFSPVKGLDLTPFCFTVTGLIYAVTVFRHGLFRLVPAARDTAIEVTADGIIVTDDAGRVLDINPSARRMIGVAGTGAGRHIREIWPDCPEPAAGTGREQITTVASTDPAGNARVLEVRSQPVEESRGKVTGRLVLIRDISEWKKVEAELKRSYEDERCSRRQVEEEINRRMEYNRALVHELNTPLTAMIAASELLAEEVSQGEPGRLAVIVHRGALSLSNRVEQLLDLSQAETGVLKIQQKPVDLRQLLQRVTEAMTPRVSKMAQTLTLEVPPVLPLINGDETRLRGVVMSLVENASKYTASGGSIRIGARVELDERVVVEVQDNGRGISPEDLPYVFDPYHRKSGDRERFGGLGISLSLSKMVIELHGGKIWIDSEPGKGSRVSFSLPVRRN